MANDTYAQYSSSLDRRRFLALRLRWAVAGGTSAVQSAQTGASHVVTPPRRGSDSAVVQAGMLPKEADGKKLSVVERLRLGGRGWFDGVDFEPGWGIHARAGEGRRARVGGVRAHAIKSTPLEKRLTAPRRRP